METACEAGGQPLDLKFFDHDGRGSEGRSDEEEAGLEEAQVS